VNLTAATESRQLETDSQMPVISVEHLSHTFESSKGPGTEALRDLSLSVREGCFVAIIGPSGCGKTTLLSILAGLEAQQGTGNVLVAGERPRPGRREIGYAPARDSLLPWRRALDNAALALELQGVNRQQRIKQARFALQSMGLEQFESMYPAQLSQGMRQRVALARLFAGSPEVLLLDEPFSALDAQTRILVQEAFLKVWERTHSTVLLVTHDLGEAVTLADEVVVLTSRPARVKATYTVNLPRPRVAVDIRLNPRFHEVYEAIWQALMEEVETQESEYLDALAGGRS